MPVEAKQSNPFIIFTWFFIGAASKLLQVEETNEFPSGCLPQTIAELNQDDSVLLFNVSIDIPKVSNLPLYLLDNPRDSTNFPQTFYVIETETETSLNETLQAFSLYNSWNPRAKFLILTKNSTDKKATFKILWYHDIYEAILAVGVNFYTSHPYKFLAKCGKNPIVENIGSCANLSRLKHETRPKIENGCDFKLSVLTAISNDIHSGRDKKLGIFIQTIKLLVDKIHLNLTYIIDPANVQHIHIIKGIQSYAERIKNEFDAIPCFYRYKYYILGVLDTTVEFFFDSYVPVVAKPIPIEDVLIFLNITTRAFSYCMLVAFLIGFFVCCICKIRVFKAFWTIYSLYLLVPIDLEYPRVLKVFLLCYVIYTMHISYCFQGRLSSLFTQPIYEKSIKTLEDLLESNVLPMVQQTFREELRSMENALVQRFYAKSVPLTPEQEFNADFDYIIKYRNVSRYFCESLLNAYGAERAHFNVLKEDLLKFDMVFAYVLRKGHPFLPVLNDLIARSLEGGFAIKWLRDWQLTRFTPNEEMVVVLTMQHLSGPFVLLICGYVLSIAAFTVETCYRCIWK